jgi:hypothetical protein
MAFISSSTTVLSFAEYQDVLDRDQRLFDENEGLTENDVDDLLIRSTERIMSKLNSDLKVTIDINNIKSRQNDFTELCVNFALHKYILPKIADFGPDDDNEVSKISFYRNEFDQLYGELVSAGDWYDINEDGTVEETESVASTRQRRKVR